MGNSISNATFHAYVQSILTHLPEWTCRSEQNQRAVQVSGSDETVIELHPYVTIVHTGSSAEIVFSRDDYRGKFEAKVQRGRMVNGRQLWLGDEYKATAGFSQGRDAKQVARTVLAKVAPAALKAATELDTREQDQQSARAAFLGAIATLNGAKVLNRPIAQPRETEQLAHFYPGGGGRGYVEVDGTVKISTGSLDAATAARIIAILNEAAKV